MNSSKEVILLRLNDLNAKVKNIDRKMSILMEKIEYNNIIINELKEDINNNSFTQIVNRNISPIRSPKYYENIRRNDINNAIYESSITSHKPQKAEETYLGVPTFKSLRNSPTYFPEIKSPRNGYNKSNPINANKNKNKMSTRRSFDSLNSYNF